MNKGVIIQASSRSYGNTNVVVTTLQKETDYDIIDLNKLRIKHFDYEFKNKNDDFKPLFNKITSNYTTLVFATPVYWYTMSGLLKVFFDRISDFLNHDKAVGRRLRGMKMGVLSCSDENDIFEGFSIPFQKSAEYLGMQYLGHKHTWISNSQASLEVKTIIKNFARSLEAHV